MDISIHHSMKGETSNVIATVTFNKLISVLNRNMSTTSQTKKSEHIFMHYHPKYSWRSNTQIQCIGYDPPAPSFLRRKGVRRNNFKAKYSLVILFTIHSS